MSIVLLKTQCWKSNLLKVESYPIKNSIVSSLPNDQTTMPKLVGYWALSCRKEWELILDITQSLASWRKKRCCKSCWTSCNQSKRTQGQSRKRWMMVSSSKWQIKEGSERQLPSLLATSWNSPTHHFEPNARRSWKSRTVPPTSKRYARHHHMQERGAGQEPHKQTWMRNCHQGLYSKLEGALSESQLPHVEGLYPQYWQESKSLHCDQNSPPHTS